MGVAKLKLGNPGLNIIPGVSAAPNRHHDALELPDGKLVLLTHLCKGQKATVLQLPASVSVKVEVTKPHASLVV